MSCLIYRHREILVLLYSHLEEPVCLTIVVNVETARNTLFKFFFCCIGTLAHNTLVPGVGEFNPLHNSHTAEKASAIVDGEAGRHCNHFGLTVNDPRHILFLPNKLLGHGLRHAGSTALCGKARELEIHSSADSHLGSMIRARLMALRAENSTSPNFLRRAIVELATYGCCFRDTFTSFHSELMERLLRADPDYAPALGTPGHTTTKNAPESKRADTCMGAGHPELAKIAPPIIGPTTRLAKREFHSPFFKINSRPLKPFDERAEEAQLVDDLRLDPHLKCSPRRLARAEVKRIKEVVIIVSRAE